jgi:outer membrane protein assembly factor BamB
VQKYGQVVNPHCLCRRSRLLTSVPTCTWTGSVWVNYLAADWGDTGQMAWSSSQTFLQFGTGIVFAPTATSVRRPEQHLELCPGCRVATLCQLGGTQLSSLALGPNGLLYVGSDDCALYAVDTLSRTVMWNFTSAGPISSPVVGTDGTVYAGCGNCSMFIAGNGSTCALKWKAALGSGRSWHALPGFTGWDADRTS